MEDKLNPLYLVKVESGANNNKYYRLIPNGNQLDVQYGRIGVTGYQTASYPISQWDKKLKEKLKKGYIDQSRLVAEPVIKKAKKQYIDIESPSIATIVSRLQAMARQAIEDNYTISSNKVSKNMIDEAQVTLNNLISTDTIESFNTILVELFKIIPRKMGKVIDYLAKDKENFSEIIQREQDLLDVMKGQVVEKDIVEEDENNSPEVNKTILEAMGLEFSDITENDKDLIKKQLGRISNRYYQAWKVTNLKTQKRFDNFMHDNKINDVRLLFHGSRSENWWSIINSGLLLKPTNAIKTGSMFGNGCYFSNDSEKSLNYTSIDGSYWSKGRDQCGFMGLFNILYGKPYNVYSFDSKFYNLNYELLQKMCPNANSLHAHGGTGMLRKDEIIVYKEEQITIKYLVELK